MASNAEYVSIRWRHDEPMLVLRLPACSENQLLLMGVNGITAHTKNPIFNIYWSSNTVYLCALYKHHVYECIICSTTIVSDCLKHLKCRDISWHISCQFRWLHLFQNHSHPWRRHQMETFFALLAICAEVFAGHRWIRRTKASDAELLMFSLICARINSWISNHKAGDLRRHRAHYDVSVMQ